MNNANVEKDYEPFGSEWEASMNSWRKADLIAFLKKAFIKNVRMDDAMNRILILSRQSNIHEAMGAIKYVAEDAIQKSTQP